MWADIKLVYFLFLTIGLFHPCHGLLQAILSNEQLLRPENQVKQFVELLKRIQRELQYDHIVVLKDVAEKRSCICEDSMIYINKPIIVLRNLNDTQLQHSNNFLLITCSVEYLNHSSTVLLGGIYQYVPHVIWLDSEEEERRANAKMAQFCSNIHKNGYFRNLIITPQSLERDANYFRCDLQGKLISVSHRLFANPFMNMQGLPIVTETDQLAPRSMLFYDEFGRLRVIGFLANYLTTFAERYNASLIIVPPANVGVTVHYRSIVNKTFQGLLDIAAVAVALTADTAFQSYSYPVELTEFCYMIPLPHFRPAYKVYFEIIEEKAMIIIFVCFLIFAALVNIWQRQHTKVQHWNRWNVCNIILNDKVIRGLLGQSFVMPRKTSLAMKYILFLVCYSSILLSTSYEAYLQSHLIHPSLEKRMETYDDIRRNNMKILMGDPESLHIYRTTIERHRDLFVKENSLDRFLKLRDGMDTRYIYPVSLTRWSVFNERQKLFQRKLFYYSSQLCLANLALLSLPLRPGLPYKFQFDQHLLDVRDVGLLDRWLQHNFLNMVRLKISSYKDLSIADEYGSALELIDLLWIWISYAVCVSLSLLVFMGELLVNKFKMK